jgi:hypothetical protein
MVGTFNLCLYNSVFLLPSLRLSFVDLERCCSVASEDRNVAQLTVKTRLHISVPNSTMTEISMTEFLYDLTNSPNSKDIGHPSTVDTSAPIETMVLLVRHVR